LRLDGRPGSPYPRDGAGDNRVCPDGQAQEFTPLAFRVFDKIQTVTL
jgi:hypothetical protein